MSWSNIVVSLIFFFQKAKIYCLIYVLERKEHFWDWKLDFYIVEKFSFSKGVNHDFGQNLAFSLKVVFLSNLKAKIDYLITM